MKAKWRSNRRWTPTLQRGTAWPGQRAFCRTDLAAVIFAVAAATIFGTACLQQSRNSAGLARCVLNLRELGLATALYEADDDGRLPFAFIRFGNGHTDSVTWDALIFPYLEAGQSNDISSSAFDRKHALLKCPEDLVERRDLEGSRGVARSYSMSRHDMNAANWPPGPSNRTGVGMWWSAGVSSGWSALTNATTSGGEAPVIKITAIPAPAKTLLLTEQMRATNLLFSDLGATIGPLDPQFESPTAASRVHGGKVNYLMVDGHVETSSPTNMSPAWNIAKGP